MKRFSLQLVLVLLLIPCAIDAPAQTPVGLEAMQLDDLGLLRTDVRTYQASSYQRNGGNYDRGEFLYDDGDEHVMLDVQGPGCIYRIWMTGMDTNERIRIYFDNETTPSVNLTLSQFFSGDIAPFLNPLVGNDAYSSGGFICYLPMPFREGCRITTSSDANDYYNVTYQKYASADGITTFTGTEDSSAIRTAWNNVTDDPKTDTGTTLVSGDVALPVGSEVTLADLTGAGSIQQLELTLPGMDAGTSGSVSDDGRAFGPGGYCQFVVTVDPNNTGVDLTRRLDYSIGNQKGRVYVNGEQVGTWFTEGSAAGYWLDDTFSIPSTYTAGESSLAIHITFISSDNDWNEFTYWVDSIVDGTAVETDTLDVGDATSEADHGYNIHNQTWEGSGQRPYYDPGIVTVTDDGRATRDYVEFDMAIDPNNAGVRLVRRLDYTIADQRGDVYVDGDLAGQFFTEGSYGLRFIDSEVEIDAAHTAGKSNIHIKVEFVSSSNDWNEFYYWAYSHVDGEPVLTDELDVGDSASETAHNYYIHLPVWYGTRTFEYYTPFQGHPFLDVISGVRLVATWDDAATPQIDVPIGGFFGSNIGPTEVQAFPVGIVDDTMYCHLPMPYGTRANVRLVNDSNTPLDSVQYNLRYTPSALHEHMVGLGHLHARFNAEYPCTLGEDYIILDETGSGHFVGVVQTSAGPGLGYLEGDERIYVDGSLTPQLYGTGTEDFYNGGWYFNGGRFSLPTHGNPTMEGSPIATDMYRYLISDLIPFTTSILVGIEHGADNDTTSTDIWSVALYYKQPAPLATLTDELDVGDAGSESAHGYTITGQTWSGSLTETYEGDDDDVNVSDDGRHHAGTSSFTASIDPYNSGVLLRRRLDYGQAHQHATVRVDGAEVGPWYDAGSNSIDRYRDSELLIPAAITQGKSTITIEIDDLAGGADWTEFYYWVYTLAPATGIPGDVDCDGDVDYFDINPWLDALNGPATYYANQPDCMWRNGDCDGDGDVDYFDVQPFLDLLGS